MMLLYVSTTFYGQKVHYPASYSPCGFQKNPPFPRRDRPNLMGYAIKKEIPTQEAPYIYERDHLGGAEWEPRIRMINAAHNCAQIFALSIKPVNPYIAQTWYYKNSYTVEKEAKKGITPLADLPDKGRSVTGFMEPYLNFYSADFPAAYHQNNLGMMLQPIILMHQGEIEKNVSYFQPASLQERLRTILQAFLEDRQTELMALTVLNQDEPVKSFLIVKAS